MYDAHRLTGQQFPEGHTDSSKHRGLGKRLTNGDPTDTYSYLADGVLSYLR